MLCVLHKAQQGGWCLATPHHTCQHTIPTCFSTVYISSPSPSPTFHAHHINYCTQTKTHKPKHTNQNTQTKNQPLPTSYRVKLATPRDGSDYINANRLTSPPGEQPGWGYIAAQGPMTSTAADFWQMVFEQGSDTVRVYVLECVCVCVCVLGCTLAWSMCICMCRCANMYAGVQCSPTSCCCMCHNTCITIPTMLYHNHVSQPSRSSC